MRPLSPSCCLIWTSGQQTVRRCKGILGYLDKIFLLCVWHLYSQLPWLIQCMILLLWTNWTWNCSCISKKSQREDVTWSLHDLRLWEITAMSSSESSFFSPVKETWGRAGGWWCKNVHGPLCVNDKLAHPEEYKFSRLFPPVYNFCSWEGPSLVCAPCHYSVRHLLRRYRKVLSWSMPCPFIQFYLTWARAWGWWRRTRGIQMSALCAPKALSVWGHV